MQEINLLPDLKLAKKRAERINKIAAFALVATIIFFAVTGLGIVALTIFQNEHKKNLQASYDQLKLSEETDEQFQVEITDQTTGKTSRVHIRKVGGELQDQLRVLDGLLANRIFWKNLMTALAKNVPSGINLTQVSSDGQTVDVKGTGRDYLAVVKFVNSLEHYTGDEPEGAPLFTEVVLGPLPGETGSVTFSVRFKAASEVFYDE